jgi:hypothetical protein
MKSVMGGEKHCCLVQLALNWLQGWDGKCLSMTVP